MARIRGIKPEFFLDPDLSDLPHASRLAFIALWCYADKSGRLEDEPRKLSAVIFPYEKANMESILQSLAKKPFLIRYSVDSRKYIQIINFDKHQRPHHTEKDSTIPEPNHSLTVIQPLLNGDSPVDTVRDTVHREGEQSEFLSYFNLKTGKRLTMSGVRRRVITTALMGRPLEELKLAVDNFSKDDWSDRHKYMDIIYCIGTLKGVDNAEKWINSKQKVTSGGLDCDAPFPKHYK